MPKSKEAGQVEHWIKEIDQARMREKDYRKNATKVVALYEGDQADQHPYNILYSNTETLAPAVYNNTPRPIVGRRFKDDDPIGLEVAKLLTKTLEFLADPGEMQYATYDNLMDSAVFESLVTGRGQVRFKYDAEVTDAGVNYETCCGEPVPWNHFLHGYAKKWEKVPWVAYEHFMDKQDLVDNFGVEVGNKINLAESIPEEEANGDSKMERGVPDMALVLEIWDKASKKVIFITSGYKDGPVKLVDDPLGLTGFFNCPKPMAFFHKIKDLLPTPLYKQYENQAKELNEVTRRIDKITRAMKVRGMYDSRVDGIDKVLKSDDTVMTPITNLTQIGDTQVLENAIWLMPLDKLAAALQGLYLQRTQIKNVIYEITGIADILRGSSVASETATAQQIKDRWGTLRLKRFQREVARFCKDSYRLMAEISAKHFKQETFSAMTGVKYLTQAEKAQAQQQIQQFQAMSQQAQQAGQPAPQPPPGADQIMALMQKPTWEELMAAMKSDLTRAYKIDIETNSTVDVEATEDKTNIAELMNAMSQFLAGMKPLIEGGQLPPAAAKGMLLAITRRFRFGDEMEGWLEKIGTGAPPPNPQAELDKQKLAMDQAKMQADQQATQARLQAETAHNQAELQLEQAKMQGELQIEREKMQQEVQLEREKMLAEVQIEREKAQLEAGLRQQELQHTAAIEGQKLAASRETEVMKINAGIAQSQMEHESATKISEAEGLRTKQAAMRAESKDQTATLQQMKTMMAEMQAAIAEKNQDQMAKMVEMMTKTVAAASGAKKVIRDEKGQVSGVEPA